MFQLLSTNCFQVDASWKKKLLDIWVCSISRLHFLWERLYLNNFAFPQHEVGKYPFLYKIAAETILCPDNTVSFCISQHSEFSRASSYGTLYKTSRTFLLFFNNFSLDYNNMGQKRRGRRSSLIMTADRLTD